MIKRSSGVLPLKTNITPRWLLLTIVWGLAFVAPFVMTQHASAISEIAIFALFALSLDLVLGYAGIVSLGHAAFFGFGAYTAALVAKHLTPDPMIGLCAAIASTTLLGGFASFTVLRGGDLSRIMVTLGASLILLEVANKLDWLTGGADGLQGVVLGPIWGRFEFDLAGQTAAVYSIAVLLICFLLARRVVDSPFGATLRAIRDNHLRAVAIGIPVAARLSAIYTFAAALAGCAGALLAQTTGFVSLDVFDFQRSADVVLMLVIGAAGWLYGGLLGAIIFKVLHLVLSGLSPQYWIFWVGLFLVLLVLIGRERLLRPWTIARTRLTSAFAGSRRRPASTLMSRTSEEKS